MTKRIFRSICLVALAVLIGAVVVILGALYNYFTGVQRRQLAMQTSLAAQAVTNEGADYLNSLRNLDTRITWIAADGTVLFDSHSDHGAMENHLEREEVREAQETGRGDSIRFSDTLAEQTVYTAQKLPDGTVLRLSMAQYSVVKLVLGMAEPIVLILTAAVILALWLAHRLSRSIVRPLNALNLDDPLSNREYEEIAPLLGRLDSQQRQLKAQETELKRKQREFDAISNNMEEGLVLLNDRFIVLTMNPAAARLIGLSRPFVGINFFTVAQVGVMEEVLRSATEGKRADARYSVMDREYQVEANPVKTGGTVSGVVLLILDVTEKHRAETQRREFTANVSHELKTPLHSISGYAELMKSGLVRSEDMANFAGRIYTEAQRLIRLVEDILRLSRLDEDADADRREPVDLYVLAREAIQNMESTAEKNQVTLHLAGASTPVFGSRQQLYGLVLNLCSNAIKYNRPGGRVDVDIRREEGHAVLTVADTGIGIAPEHHQRIFQRFYRVDKSHSKAVGGTGLGLSIVKHAALNHNAKIELESQVGEGTTIRVVFPA
ncbi:MAG: PAS domain-containing sensor histidine kinase [Oscillospiraceae bacterium]|nr:PAS domain-containing sensor histidine kinase [Oscillospiraceae bacterium]